jgi:hypothetical protein
MRGAKLLAYLFSLWLRPSTVVRANADFHNSLNRRWPIQNCSVQEVVAVPFFALGVRARSIQ